MSSLRTGVMVACLLVCGSALADMKVVSEGKAIQVRTDEIVVRSEGVGREFLIEVRPPEELQSDRRYAAVYALDGGLGVAGPAAPLLIAGRRTAPFFLVAIGYPNSMGRHRGPRNTDLAHRRVKVDGEEFGGGGAAFEAFILKELRPYLEARYPLDPKQAVLFGHSGGGLFAATVLVTNPGSFSGYVIGGVPLIYDSPLAQQAREVAPRGRGQRVFIGLAPMDALNTNSDQFAAPLSGPGSKFKVRQEVFEEETHNSEYLQLIARGLPFVLPTETAELVATRLKSEILDRHVGTYRIDGRQTVTLSRRGNDMIGRLNRTGGGLSQFVLEAETETRFFSRATDAILTFAPAAGGKSPSVLIRRDGRETTAEREE